MKPKSASIRRGPRYALLVLAAIAVTAHAGTPRPRQNSTAAAKRVNNPAALINPLIGSANGGNTFPGAVVPFGMVQWSPETTRGQHTKTPAPGGYQYDATKTRGFSLTHLSGAGCRGASGDIPFMPYVGSVKSSPSQDLHDKTYAGSFSHANEKARAGDYKVRLANGVTAELTATARTGSGRFSFPENKPATMLIRASDSEVGSSDAHVNVDASSRTVTGSVTSGNFCGYIDKVDRRSYYTLYFVAEFNRPFKRVGTWENAKVSPGSTSASGGTGYGPKGLPVPGKGSGAYVRLDMSDKRAVTVRVGISYVSLKNAKANLKTENKAGKLFDKVKKQAYSAWNKQLRKIQITGGTKTERTVFYTALYHSLLHPNLFSDVNGQYRGLDQKIHTVGDPQGAQYANFSGWDIYRSQLQLVTLLDPKIGSDIAQSLLNQAEQNDGKWDRWTHNSGATHVMEGDPSPAAIADIYAFGGADFNVKAALKSLVKAASTPTHDDLRETGCPVECTGQRPSLDQWLKIHYIPTKSHAWGGAGETLEDVTADFSLAQLAERLGNKTLAQRFLKRAQYWKNIFNPHAVSKRGYMQNRNKDGSWPKFDPASSKGFAEGSSAQYTWMVPFNVNGLFKAMGGRAKANQRLDDFFHKSDGGWALTDAGGMHAELNNEPSIATPWLYDFSGKPYKTQQTVREVVNTLWKNKPDGIPGNDDLGEMSSWYVWSALGMYPEIPGRAELMLASPLFPHIRIQRANGKTITINAPQAAADTQYITGLKVNGQTLTKPWLPESFTAHGGTLHYSLSSKPNKTWGSKAGDAPPSFPASTEQN